MIIDDYLEYSKKYKAKYGDKCIVLMQVGSFFELYSIDDSITDNDIYNIADICNIQIAKKNKNIIEFYHEYNKQNIHTYFTVHFAI